MAETIKIDNVFDDESLHVGQVYAKALIGAAEPVGAVDLVVDEFQSIVSEVLDTQPTLMAIFGNPRVDIEAKLAIIDRLFLGKISPTLLNFLKVVGQRRRLSMLKTIQQAASEMRDTALGRLHVLVTTAEALDPSSLESVRLALATKFNAPVWVTTKVDPSIVGGLVIRIGDIVYDGSVDGQLKNLQKATLAKAGRSIRDRIGSLAS